jgi:hypothetical protein
MGRRSRVIHLVTLMPDKCVKFARFACPTRKVMHLCSRLTHDVGLHRTQTIVPSSPSVPECFVLGSQTRSFFRRAIRSAVRCAIPLASMPLHTCAPSFRVAIGSQWSQRRPAPAGYPVPSHALGYRYGLAASFGQSEVHRLSLSFHRASKRSLAAQQCTGADACNECTFTPPQFGRGTPQALGGLELN